MTTIIKPLCFLLIKALVCALAVVAFLSAAQITLVNGTTFTGEFVSQNDNFIIIKKGGSNVSIAKKMISRVSDLPPGVTVTLTAEPGQANQGQPSTPATPAPVAPVPATPAPVAPVPATPAPAAPVPATPAPAAPVPATPAPAAPVPATPAPSTDQQQSAATDFNVRPGMELVITLKNGSRFLGTVITCDERIINIQAENGSRLNVYKHIIAGITDRTSGKPIAAAPQPATVPPVTQTPASTPSPTPVPASPVDGAKPVIPPAGATPTTVIPATKDTSTLIRSPVTATPSQKQPPTADDAKAQSPSATAAPIPATPATTAVPVTPPVVPAPMIIPSAPVSTAPPIIPQKVVTVPTPKKRPDGKTELVLKNGTVFIGTIVSENERVLSISTTSGATINVIRRMIKEIDGVPYVMTSGQGSLQQDTALHPQRVSTGQAPPRQDLDLKKPVAGPKATSSVIPVIALKQGISASELSDSLASPSIPTRSMAARNLGGMGQWAVASIPKLAALLADTAHWADPLPLEIDSLSIQKMLAPGYEAARALSRMGTPGLDALNKNSRSVNPLVRQRAVFGLGCADNGAGFADMQLALKDAEGGVRVSAVWGMRTGEALDALVGALKDRDGDVRTYAAASLVSLADERSMPGLIDALKDLRPQTRALAAKALGRIKVQVAVPALSILLTDVSPDVRSEAAIALGAIADTASVNALCTAARDSIPRVRKQAILALGAIRDPRAIPTLYTAMQSETDTLRSTVEQVLKLHTDIPLLIAALEDKNSLVRENAAYILWLMTGKDIGQDKQAWTDWYTQENARQKKTGKDVPAKSAEKQSTKQK
jgi:HEAT repeat protein/sRNA-binding regulator protein Hfq